MSRDDVLQIAIHLRAHDYLTFRQAVGSREFSKQLAGGFVVILWEDRFDARGRQIGAE